jgi:hypothetical protein
MNNVRWIIKAIYQEIFTYYTNSGDVRKSQRIIGEVLAFIGDNGAKSVSMVDDIIGCPHEEGIDYPEGGSCPKCGFWKGRDRFTKLLNS